MTRKEIQQAAKNFHNRIEQIKKQLVKLQKICEHPKADRECFPPSWFYIGKIDYCKCKCPDCFKEWYEYPQS